MRGTLNLQVSLDGRTFASGSFPPGMHPDSHVGSIAPTLQTLELLMMFPRHTLSLSQALNPSSYT
jgi:hypothetical protein